MKRVIIIAGPTASGKTAYAVELALSFNTEIIGADSRQIYKHIPILTATPTMAECKNVPHHLISHLELDTTINAAIYEQMALQKINELLSIKDTVIICGGSMMYIDALAQGIDVIPDIPQQIRNECINQYTVNGLAWLQQMVKDIDPTYYSQTDKKNPRRLLRAYETYKATGDKLSQYRTGTPIERQFNIEWHILMPTRPILFDKINHRVDIMMQSGALEEAKNMLPFKHLNSLKTVGFKELFQYLEGSITLEKAVEQIKRNTRIYAKKQTLWCRKKIEKYSMSAFQEDNGITIYSSQ